MCMATLETPGNLHDKNKKNIKRTHTQVFHRNALWACSKQIPSASPASWSSEVQRRWAGRSSQVPARGLGRRATLAVDRTGAPGPGRGPEAEAIFKQTQFLSGWETTRVHHWLFSTRMVIPKSFKLNSSETVRE